MNDYEMTSLKEVAVLSVCQFISIGERVWATILRHQKTADVSECRSRQ